jgi:hypothetical protein
VVFGAPVNAFDDFHRFSALGPVYVHGPVFPQGDHKGFKEHTVAVVAYGFGVRHSAACGGGAAIFPPYGFIPGLFIGKLLGGDTFLFQGNGSLGAANFNFLEKTRISPGGPFDNPQGAVGEPQGRGGAVLNLNTFMGQSIGIGKNFLTSPINHWMRSIAWMP